MKRAWRSGFNFLLAISFTATSLFAIAQPGAKPDQVLFIGNSFTYYNDGLHKHYSNLLRAAGVHKAGETKNRMLTYSGSGLWEHLAALQSALTNEPWQAVIMHDYSNGPLTHWERFIESSKKLQSIARSHNVTPYYLMTWAYEGETTMAPKIAEAYTRAGKKLGIDVIPVGLAFATAIEAGSINLYTPDLHKYQDGQPVYKKVVKHPSLAGTYLAACTVYAALTGNNPQGLVYHAGLQPDDALLLQKAAWQTVQTYIQSN